MMVEFPSRLHDDMAAALPHFGESMRTKNGADFGAGQNA